MDIWCAGDARNSQIRLNIIATMNANDDAAANTCRLGRVCFEAEDLAEVRDFRVTRTLLLCG